MTTDKLDALGPMITEIGLEAVELTGGDPNGIFLYAEAGEIWVGPSLFKDEGTVVRYYDYGKGPLPDLIMTARESEPDVEKRWSVMELMIENGKFEAKFKFPEEVDVETTVDDDRREAVLRARYGDKPRVYPPPPWNAEELMPEND